MPGSIGRRTTIRRANPVSGTVTLQVLGEAANRNRWPGDIRPVGGRACSPRQSYFKSDKKEKYDVGIHEESGGVRP